MSYFRRKSGVCGLKRRLPRLVYAYCRNLATLLTIIVVKTSEAETSKLFMEEMVTVNLSVI